MLNSDQFSFLIKWKFLLFHFMTTGLDFYPFLSVGIMDLVVRTSQGGFRLNPHKDSSRGDMGGCLLSPRDTCRGWGAVWYGQAMFFHFTSLVNQAGFFIHSSSFMAFTSSFGHDWTKSGPCGGCTSTRESFLWFHPPPIADRKMYPGELIPGQLSGRPCDMNCVSHREPQAKEAPGRGGWRTFIRFVLCC